MTEGEFLFLVVGLIAGGAITIVILVLWDLLIYNKLQEKMREKQKVIEK